MNERIETTRAGSLIRIWGQDLAAATIFLTRVPIPWRGAWPPGIESRSQRAFPVIGAAIGLAGGAAYALAACLGLPPLPSAFLAVAAQTVLTGGFHEDGLADVADSVGGRSRQHRLDIMHDSRIGSFGTLALILAIGLRVAAIASLAHPAAVAAALLAAGAVSRGLVLTIIQWLAPARTDGLAAAAGRPGARNAVAGLALGLVAAALAIGPGGAFLALAAGAAGAIPVLAYARRAIGGHTGDVLGAIQQTAEIAILLALVARS